MIGGTRTCPSSSTPQQTEADMTPDVKSVATIGCCVFIVRDSPDPLTLMFTGTPVNQHMIMHKLKAEEFSAVTIEMNNTATNSPHIRIKNSNNFNSVIATYGSIMMCL